MTHLTDRWVVPWLALLADWSVRWGVVLAVLAAWLALRPPRRAATRHLLCLAALVAGVLLPVAPRWGDAAVPWPSWRCAAAGGSAASVPPPVQFRRPRREARLVAGGGRSGPAASDPEAVLRTGRSGRRPSRSASTDDRLAGRVAARGPGGGRGVGGGRAGAAGPAGGRVADAGAVEARGRGGGLEIGPPPRRVPSGAGAVAAGGARGASGGRVARGRRRPRGPWCSSRPTGATGPSRTAAPACCTSWRTWRGTTTGPSSPRSSSASRFFFHPLVRWLLARLDRERELLCDEAVVALGLRSRRLRAPPARPGPPARPAAPRHDLVPSRLAPLPRPPHRRGPHRATPGGRHAAAPSPARPSSRSFLLGTLAVAAALGVGGLRVRAVSAGPTEPPKAPSLTPSQPNAARPPRSRRSGRREGSASRAPGRGPRPRRPSRPRRDDRGRVLRRRPVRPSGHHDRRPGAVHLADPARCGARLPRRPQGWPGGRRSISVSARACGRSSTT